MRRVGLAIVAALGSLLATAVGTSQSPPLTNQSPVPNTQFQNGRLPSQPSSDVSEAKEKRPAVQTTTHIPLPIVPEWQDAQKWSLERLDLRDGRVLQGLILRETEDLLDLDEVRRPPGRPMVLIRRRFPQTAIRQIDRLNDEDRRALADRLDRYRNRSLEETQSMAAVKLQKEALADTILWRYRESPWFELESRADEELTRRAIVRIEQMFAAFAVILPPRPEARRERLRISLFDTQQAYREFQAALGVDLRNPAFYLRDKNVLAAGAEASTLVRNLAAVREKNAATKAALDDLNKQIPVKLQQAVKEFTSQGRKPDETKQLVGLMRANLQREMTTLQTRLSTAERENTKQFENFTGVMFQRLYHEAFHAYLENFVYPSDVSDVPRWLNEGLAQVFEEGVIEVGTLRLDMPGKTRLSQLQKDLRENPRLPLAEILESTADRFLVSHEQQARESQRLYLYSWGLAYYLAIREPVLQSKALDQYVAAGAKDLPPIKRFERMVGQPLDEFEKRWRKEMGEYELK
ncbi:MAG: DUF1570 domain-containing protein [Pirellulales bacterium]